MSKDKYPKVMLVGDHFPLVHKRVVFAEKQGIFFAWNVAETLEDAEKETNIVKWKYAEDIKPENPLKKELLAKADELVQKAKELVIAASKL